MQNLIKVRNIEIELGIQQFTYLCFGPCFTKFEMVFWMVWDGSMKILLSYKWTLVKINKLKHHCCCLAAKLCLSISQPYGLLPTRFLCPWDFPGKNKGAGCHFFLQAIMWTQGSNLNLLHWQADSLPLSHQGSQQRHLT